MPRFGKPKPKKKKYRLVITIGDRIQKKTFHELGDNQAITKFINKIHQLPPGSVIVLDRWNKEEKRWAFVKRGGKDVVRNSPPKQLVLI